MSYAGKINGNLAIANTQVGPSFIKVVELPEDKLFLDSFELQGDKVVVNFDKAKEQAHDMRRAKRDADMAPLDRQYTYDPEGAEPLREDVRNENAKLQGDIDKCKDVESLTELMQ